MMVSADDASSPPKNATQPVRAAIASSISAAHANSTAMVPWTMRNSLVIAFMHESWHACPPRPLALATTDDPQRAEGGRALPRAVRRDRADWLRSEEGRIRGQEDHRPDRAGRRGIPVAAAPRAADRAGDDYEPGLRRNAAVDRSFPRFARHRDAHEGGRC